MELEAEVQKLKDENQELREKQVILVIAGCHKHMLAHSRCIYGLSSPTFSFFFSLIHHYLDSAG